MTGNIIRCALTNIRRKSAVSVLLLILYALMAGTLFLVLVAARYLAVPDLAAFGRFFSAFVIAVSAADAVVLFAIALFFAQSRRREIGIYRIHGARKTDILFLNAVEMLFLSFSGSFTGVLIGLLATAFGAFDLPSLFGGGKGVMIIGTGGQIVFGIPAFVIALASIVTGRLLREGDGDLMRGTH
jgi:hypothetical protein